MSEPAWYHKRWGYFEAMRLETVEDMERAVEWAGPDAEAKVVVMGRGKHTELKVLTHWGTYWVSLGDWLTKGEQGVYFCQDSDFTGVYEKVPNGKT